MGITSPAVPIAYRTPSWPSLYWPINALPDDPKYLYSTGDIWRFTIYWTFVAYGLVHGLTSAWAVIMQIHSAASLHRRRARTARQSRRHAHSSSSVPKPKPITVVGPTVRETLLWVWMVPLVYLVVGGVEALFAGSIAGLVLGAVYNAGYFKMSTWTPFVWGVTNMLVLVLSSFSVQGGL